jgi:hypothetical protein
MEKGANRLIGAIGTLLGDYVFRSIFGIFSKKAFKKIFKNLLKKLCTILLRFVLKVLQKICHFQSFPSPFTSSFTI